MTNNEDQKKKPSGPPHVSDLILGSLKPRTGKETSKWIAGLADNTIKDAAEAAAREMETGGPTPSGSQQAVKSNSAKQAVVMFTDQLFDHFQQYEFDFNRTVAGTDYVISIERPIFNTEQVRQRFASSETVKVFKGRVSTRYWTLIIRACNETIEAWILPVEAIFSFRADDEMNPPYIKIEPVATRAGELAWRVNGVNVTVEQTRNLAKQIFAALIRKARGEMPDNEQFAIVEKADLRATGEIVNPPTQPVAPVSVPYSLNQPSSSGERRALPLGSVPLQGQPEPTQLQGQSHPGSRVDLQGQNPHGHGQGRQSDQPNMQPMLQAPSPKSPKTTLRNTRKQSAAATAMVQEQFAGEPTVDAAIAALNAAVNKELEKLSVAGAEAFSKQDMVMVEQIFKKTTKVRDLHIQINSLLEQWKRALQDALES